MSNLSFAPSSTHLCSAFSGLGKKCVIREKQNHLVTLPLVSLRSPWRMSFNESNYSPVSNNIRSSKVFDSVFEAIGNTPLIKLRRASDESGCNVYGKAEFMNPGGSIKARTALYLIKDAEDRGLLTPGQPDTIVESSGGNTGISLAQIATARGYTYINVMSDDQSEEKKDQLRQGGATIVEVPKAPYTSPNNYIQVGRRLSSALGAVFANQFDNTANRSVHFDTTGPEIWAQLNGEVDGFSCAVGTGGTLAGTSQFLRSVSAKVKIGITDPQGAKLVHYFRTGEFKSVGESLTEGIGQERITANLEGFTPDYIFEIPDEEGLQASYALMQEEGLYLGTSSAINVAGAMRMAKALGPGHNIVTMLCDSASRYPDKLFNIDFLESKNLPTPKWMRRAVTTELEAVVRKVLVSEEMATYEQMIAEQKIGAEARHSHSKNLLV